MASDTVGTLKIELSCDNSKFEKALQKTEKESRKFSEIVRDTIITNIATMAFDKVISAISDTIQKMKDFASSTMEIGKAFDTSMSNVAAISGASGDGLTALRDKAKEMGAATKFTATEAADAMSYMAMAGWKTEDMLNGVAGVMNLAAAGQTDLAEASDIVTDALTAFGQSASESGRLADIMAAASANSNTNVSMLGETFKYVAPVAGALNYSMEDTAVAIGLMANAGIKASQAGTSLRSLLTNLAKPTDSMAEAMSALGISLTDSSGAMKPMATVVNELRSAFAGLDEAQQASYAATLAGKEGMSGLLAIVNASDADYNSLTAAINGSTGAAEKMAYTMIDNLGGAQEMVNSKMESLKLSLYEGLEPAMMAVTKATGAMISALSDADGSMEILALASDDIVNGFSNMANTLPDTIGQIASNIPVVLGTIVPAFQTAIPMIVNAFSGLVPAILNAISSSLPTLIEAFFSVVSSIIVALLGALPQLIDVGMKMVGELLQGISQAIPTILEKIAEIIPQIVATLIDNIGILIEAAIQLMMAIVEAVPKIIPPLIEALPGIIDNIIRVFQENLPVILQGAVDMFMAILQALPQIIALLGEALPNVIRSITGFLKDPSTINMILNAALTMFQALIDSLPDIITALAEALPDVIGSIVEFLTNPSVIMQLINAAVQLFFALVQAVPQILGALIGAFGTLVGSLWEGIKQMFGAFASNFGEFIGGIFRTAINGVLGFIESIVNKPIDILNGFIGLINDTFGFIGVNLGTIDRVQLPRLAQGGYANSATAAVFGEAGKEVALPLERNTDNWSGLLAAALAEEFEMGEVAGGGDRPIENTQNIYINDKMDIRKVGNAFLQEIRRV